MKKESGFISLFTVLITSIILAMTIGIASITWKGLILTSLARDGATAFYAADAGVECILFNDLELAAFEFGNGIINCGDATINFSSSAFGDADIAFSFSTDDGEFIQMSSGCAQVTLTRTAGTDEFGNLLDPVNVIDSKGYSVSCEKLVSSDTSRIVQRAIRVSY